MKRMVAGIAGAVVVCALVVGVMMYLGRDKGPAAYNPADYAAFGSFEVSECGDSLGSSYDLTLHRLSDDTCEIRLTTQEAHNQPEVLKKGTGDAAFIALVTDIMVQAGMPGWGDMPQDDIFALDAGTTYVTYVYAGQTHRYDSDQILPDGGWSAIREIMSLAESRVH